MWEWVGGPQPVDKTCQTKKAAKLQKKIKNIYKLCLADTGKVRRRSTNTVGELSSYHHISKKKVWKYYHATISIWSPPNSGVKISVLLKGFRICNSICTPFLGFGSYRPVCLKKAQNLEVFYLSPFWNLNFEISKVNFLKNFWSSFLWKTSS